MYYIQNGRLPQKVLRENEKFNFTLHSLCVCVCCALMIQVLQHHIKILNYSFSTKHTTFLKTHIEDQTESETDFSHFMAHLVVFTSVNFLNVYSSSIHDVCIHDV